MSAMTLMHVETGRKITKGDILLHSDGTAWQFKAIHVPDTKSKHHGQHMIRVSRFTGKIRVTRVFLAKLFGCMIECAGYQDIRAYIKFVMDNAGLAWAGIVAYVVLLVGDHYHFGDIIFTKR
jgi:hypothetical protein